MLRWALLKTFFTGFGASSAASSAISSASCLQPDFQQRRSLAWGAANSTILVKSKPHCTAHFNDSLGLACRSAKQASQATRSLSHSLHHIFLLPIFLFIILQHPAPNSMNRTPHVGCANV